MASPVCINLSLYVLQVGTADGQSRAVFQNSRTVSDLHNMNQIDNASPVDKNKLFRPQLFIDLLQALPNPAFSISCNDPGILSFPFDIENFLIRNLFQTAARLYRIHLAFFQRNQSDRILYGRGKPSVHILFRHITKNRQLKCIYGILNVRSNKNDPL